jgi:hypothetical protein
MEKICKKMERVKKCRRKLTVECSSFIDDLILQENQSLKEQIKILSHMLYHEDVDIGKCIKSLSTEDYQLFIENNMLEDIEKL